MGYKASYGGYMGVSMNSGSENRPQYAMILILRPPSRILSGLTKSTGRPRRANHSVGGLQGPAILGLLGALGQTLSKRLCWFMRTL